MNNPLVSIIIPTYNRGHIIGETLDSILIQTYSNWECIIVDDGSTDTTVEVVKQYLAKDKRFQYHKRALDRPKGANACRNYGFELSKGEFIQWFDSDDLMEKTKIEEQINAFNESIDFVIGNSVNFNEVGIVGRPYVLNYEHPITPENFITQKIGWITNDVLLRKSAIKIKFDERLSSGQEYNFFSRLLFDTNKGVYLKKDLVKRRVHSGSIHQELKNFKQKEKQLIDNEIALLNTTLKKLSKALINRSIKRLIRFSIVLTKPFSINKTQVIVINQLLKLKEFKIALIYLLWVFFNLLLGKGYKFISLIYKRL